MLIFFFLRGNVIWKMCNILLAFISSFQSLGHVQLFVTLWSSLHSVVKIPSSLNCFPSLYKLLFSCCFCDFCLFLIFRSLTIMCLGMDFFEFIFRICLASWLCRFTSFANLGKFQPLFLWVRYQPYPLSPLYLDSDDMNVRILL